MALTITIRMRSLSFQNIAKEMEAGKPQKQAVAIAYSVKREAEKAKKASPKKK